MTKKVIVKTCNKGHQFFKSSDCPVCLICEAARKPTDGFLALLAAPARRALENANISTLKALSRYSETEIAALHGMGKTTITRLQALLKEEGLAFKKQRLIQ